MEIKYSRERFDGYTTRFMVYIQVDNDWGKDSIITIYSTSDDKQKLIQFISENKSAKVIGFEIVHTASKEDDEADSQFITEVVGNI